jgi:aerobic-type carbon monoxide dehydrogenase small subunit (CoxS/CutS family)
LGSSVSVVLNGRTVSLSYDDSNEDLLYLLRQQFDLKGPRFGCGLAQCGCCTVLVNGAAVRSCVEPVSALNAGDMIETLDGIGTHEDPHPLQSAFIANQAGQCAFCCNSMIMGALSFINARVAAGNREVPTRAEIIDFLSGNSSISSFVYLCRCGAHVRIVAAIEDAARKML